MIKIDKKNYKKIGIYYVGYVTLKEIANWNDINSVDPLYLMIDEMIGHFEEKNGNEYLVLDDIGENKKVSQKYGDIWGGIKKEIKIFNGGKIIEYG